MNGLLAWRGVGRVGLGVGGSGPPSPAQTHLHLSLGCGPREAGGSGRVWLHCSSPSCTLPGWPRAGGSSRTGPSQSHRKLQGSRAVSRAALAPSARGSPLLLEAGRHRAGTPGSHSRPQGQAAGSHLAEGKARPGGRGRPARCRCAPPPRPQPRTPPGQAQGKAGSGLVWTALGREQGPSPRTHPPGPLGLHLHGPQAPGEPSMATDTEHLSPPSLLHVDLQGTCPVRPPARVSSSGGQRPLRAPWAAWALEPVWTPGPSSGQPSPGFWALRWYQKVRQAGRARGLCSSEVRDATRPCGRACGLVSTAM